MTLVGTRVDSDALCSEMFAVGCETLHIRYILAACVAESGHLVDIDAKSCHK
jgi:hypothetical protein